MRKCSMIETNTQTLRPSRFEPMLLGLLMGLGIASSDLYVSALPNFSNVLEMSEFASSATVAFFLLTTAIGTICFLKLRRLFSLKKINMGALYLFAAASGLLLLFDGFEGLLACRIVQGIAYGMLQATMLSVAKLLFKNNVAEQFSTIGFVSEISCMFAPISGYVLLKLYGWQSPFFFISLMAILLCFLSNLVFKRVDESHDVSGEKFNVAHLLEHKGYLGWTMVTSLQSGLAWAIICLTPFVLKSQDKSDFYLCVAYTGYSVFYASGCFVIDRGIIKGAKILDLLPMVFTIIMTALLAGFFIDGIWLTGFFLYGFFVGSSYGIVMERTMENVSKKHSSRLGFFTSFMRLASGGVFVLISAYLFSLSPFIGALFSAVCIFGMGMLVMFLNRQHKEC